MQARPSSSRERLLDLLLQTATDRAFIATDRDGLVTMWNEGARVILGWEADEAIGRPIEMIYAEADRAAGVPRAELDAALATGCATDARWYLKRDGQPFWGECETRPLHDDAGRHVGTLKTLRDRTERRLADERRAADAKFMQGVLSASADCFKVLDLEGRLVFMSEGGQRVMEVDDFNAVAGCPWPDFWQGEGHVQAQQALAEARAGRTGRFQGVADTMAGNSRFWDVQVTAILGPDGRPERLLSISRDVSAAMLARRSLQEAEGLNTLILRSSRDCTVVLDLQGRTLVVSPGGIAAMEIDDVAAIIGLSWLRVWSGCDHEAACAAVAEAAAGGTGRFQGFCATHRGTPKWWDVVISPLPDADGRPDRLVSIARDITAQREAEALLRDSEERRRLAIEAASIGTWAYDPASRALLWDARCKTLFGLPDDACASYEAYREAIHPEDRERVAAASLAAQQAGGPGAYHVEYRAIGIADGIERWLAVAGKTQFRDGQAVRLHGTVVDITARRRAEQRARLLGEELQHRVRNTLAIVQAIVQQTLRNAATPAEAQAAIGPRLAALARAHDMLTDDGWEGADLAAVIGAALAPHDDATPGRFRSQGPAVWLPAEASMSMALLLHELATNAAKYGALSTAGGHVDLAWTVAPEAGGRLALHLRWQESGGPPVREPTRRGFGSRLIEHGLASALCGGATISFPPDGVTCVVRGSLPPPASSSSAGKLPSPVPAG